MAPRQRRRRQWHGRGLAACLGGAVVALGLAVSVTLGAAGPARADWRKPLADDFEGTTFAPGGGLFFKKNFEQSAGKVTFEKGPGAFSGKGYLKLSVRHICPPGREGCSERAEIWQRTRNRVPFGAGIWDGFAVRFAKPIPRDDHRYVIAQWKREIDPGAKGDWSPFLAIRMDRGKLFVTVETDWAKAVSVGPKGVRARCPAGQTPVWLRPKTHQMRALVVADRGFEKGDATDFNACTDRIRVTRHGAPLPQPGTKWVDYVIYSRPGAHGKGHIEIFADNRWIATVKGDIGFDAPGLGKNQYFKFGPYRDGEQGIWTMYYDDFRRSPQCRDVLKDAALCAKVR
ncbi:polysaccharide lyase [Acidimangrovimonas sediminis]|uniref:polysaccharide lyase n=1 Tax=Acidimangrovimonas sediminis TaxID=2056283 RepID=UPI000C7FED6B|nr:polysaccharide lyase [Acidimangrovimonas sediminis]